MTEQNRQTELLNAVFNPETCRITATTPTELLLKKIALALEALCAFEGVRPYFKGRDLTSNTPRD